MDGNQFCRVCIFDFSDVVSYLQEWVSEKRKEEPSLSLELLADRAGLSSPLLLARVLKRKKPLRLKHLEWLLPMLELKTDQEVELLRLMVLRDSSKNEDERIFFQAWIEKKVQQVNVLRKQTLLSTGDVFFDWIPMGILSLIQSGAVVTSVSEIQDRFRFPTSRERIQKSVKALLESRLIRLNSDGCFELLCEGVSTQSDIPISSIHEYYKQVSELAKSSVLMPTSDRELQCFSIPLPASKFHEFKDMLRGWRAELCGMSGDGRSESGKSGEVMTVYQANLQLFPLTKSIP